MFIAATMHNYVGPRLRLRFTVKREGGCKVERIRLRSNSILTGLLKRDTPEGMFFGRLGGGRNSRGIVCLQGRMENFRRREVFDEKLIASRWDSVSAVLLFLKTKEKMNNNGCGRR
ncbi:hypothetical protein CDAR_376261 [Caerostris darwini]|uniref:Uncharacterized protein n=1 Tax=Caerostris darwini TaxID=1538125 RepID=A0AAV4QHX2_9ARAC|nr:hypothetical protein CDAR_376261 [Caerostris darwini]